MSDSPTIDLHDPAFLADPAPSLHWLREHDPVHRSPHGYWLLTRYDDVAAALRDPRLSSEWSKRPAVLGLSPRSNDADPAYAAAQRVILTSFNMRDPSDHTRVRGLVQQAFGRAAIDRRRERIQQLVDGLLDGAGDGRLDLVTGLAFPLTITVASEMIGVPVDARDRFRTSFEDAERTGDRSATDEQRAAGRAALVWQLSFMRDLVEDRRRRPTDDLIGALVQAESDGQRLSTDEILSALVTLYTAAGTTTERFVSSGLLALLSHRDQWDALVADRSLLPGALTEILRHHHPNQQTSTPRLALEDIELHGVTIRAGDMVRVSLGAANRDPARWVDPDRFDITRPDLHPLSFGHGIHYCIGAQLARVQADVAIGTVASRFPGTELITTEPRHDPRRMDRYECIEVQLRPAS